MIATARAAVPILAAMSAVIAAAVTARGVSALQLPPSVRASAPVPLAPPSAEERLAQCNELRALLKGLRGDATWSAQPYADREVRQLQRTLDSLGCPGDDGPLGGTWRIGEWGKNDLSEPFGGTFTVKRIDGAAGVKLAGEVWGGFTMKTSPCGSTAGVLHYHGTVTWDPGSYIRTRFYQVPSGGPDGPGEILLCAEPVTGGARVTGAFRDPAKGAGGSMWFSGTAMYQGELRPNQRNPTIMIQVVRAGAK